MRIHSVSVSQAGGFARFRLHGNLGTPEGRRRGGLRSLETHKRNGTGFNLLKPVASPRPSVALAELLGILAGDGHIGKYQTTVTTNAKTDYEHAEYVASLFKKVFSVDAPLRQRRDENAVVVTVSSKEVGRLLVRKGMVMGHKIQGSLRMPAWVRLQKRFRDTFIRGLFDTDGCVYIDKHKIRGKEYKNIGLAFANRCLPLLADFKGTLLEYGLHPTQKTKYTVFLRREKDIYQYFSIFGSSNPKHMRKFEEYRSCKGGVA